LFFHGRLWPAGAAPSPACAPRSPVTTASASP
jgi:hypothetical protein